MAKKNYYAIRYPNNTGAIVDNHHDFIKGMKGVSYSEGKGFKTIYEAKIWLANVDLVKLNLSSSKQKEQKQRYYAVAIGRFVGVTKNRSKYEAGIAGYQDAKHRDNFFSKEEAWGWLERQGFSKEDKKGIYAVAKGRRTGIFTRLNTFHKHTVGYPNQVGRGNFDSKEEAKEWLAKRRRSSTDGKQDFKHNYSFGNENLPVVYTDGSYQKNQKKYGCAIIIFDLDGSVQTFTRASTNKCGSIHAEVEAFYLCLVLMKNICKKQEFVLVHDFKELERVADGELIIKNIDQELQCKIVKFIQENKMKIHFITVKSHSGVLGNAMADRYAGQAIKNYLEYEKLLTATDMKKG